MNLNWYKFNCNNKRLTELLRMYKVSPSVPTRIATTQTRVRSHPPLEIAQYAHAPSGIRIRDHRARVQTPRRCQRRLALRQKNSATRSVYFSVQISFVTGSSNWAWFESYVNTLLFVYKRL